jgi:hypothetical protein
MYLNYRCKNQTGGIWRQHFECCLTCDKRHHEGSQPVVASVLPRSGSSVSQTFSFLESWFCTRVYPKVSGLSHNETTTTTTTTIIIIIIIIINTR